MSTERYVSMCNLFNWNKKIVLAYVLTGREENIARVSEDLPGMESSTSEGGSPLCFFISMSGTFHDLKRQRTKSMVTPLF